MSWGNPARIGDEIGFTLDSHEGIHEGHFLQSRSGRTYLVTQVRVQQKGQYAQVRHHMRCIVVNKNVIRLDDVVHYYFWTRTKD